MFYIVLTLIFILPVLAGYGKLLEKVTKKIPAGLSFRLLSGTMFLTVIWVLAAFFFPLNIFIEGPTLFLGLLLFFMLKVYRDFWSFPEKKRPFFWLTLLAGIFFASVAPFNLDHFGYYVPTISWLADFGLARGIANLDLLLGQMSFWHIFQAGFSNFSDPFLRINIVAATIYIIYIFERKIWLHMLFLPALFLFLSSPSPDFPAIAFGMIVLNEILSGSRSFGYTFSLSAYIFALKPTMVWAPLAVLAGIMICGRKNLLSLLPGAAIVLLFVIKNCYCFGYPIFPVQFPGAALPWSPNPYLMKISSQIAVCKTFDMQYSFTEITRFSKWQFIENWIFLKGIKGKINALFLLTLIVTGIYTLAKKNRLPAIIFLSVLIKGIFVLLFSAQYRFFIDVFFVAAVLIFNHKIAVKTAFLLFSSGSFLLAAGFIFPKITIKNIESFHPGKMITPWQTAQLYEPGGYRLHSFRAYKIGNCKFRVAKGYPLSFDTPQPAISRDFLKEDAQAGIFPQQYGSSPKDGYYWKKLSPAEKRLLKQILSESGK